MLECLYFNAAANSSQRKNLCPYSVGSCLPLLLYYPKIHNMIFQSGFCEAKQWEGCFSSLSPTIPSAVAPFPLCTLDSHHIQQKDVCVYNRTLLEKKSHFSSPDKTSALSDTFTFNALPDMCSLSHNFEFKWTDHSGLKKKINQACKEIKGKKDGHIYRFVQAYGCSFFLPQSSVKPTDHAECFRVLFSYSRGARHQNISEIYLNCHLAAVAWVVPLCGFVHSLVWLHSLWLHCCQVSQGRLDGTPGVLEEEGGHWRTYCCPGDLGDRTGGAHRFPPGCCTDSRWLPGCLQAPSAPGKGRKLVNWSCREQGEREPRDQRRVNSYTNLSN